jgi:hypothetical protein
MQTISNLCIPDKNEPKLIPKVHLYIFKFIYAILARTTIDAAVSLWRNIIPKGIMITNMMPVHGIEPGLPTMSL